MTSNVRRFPERGKRKKIIKQNKYLSFPGFTKESIVFTEVCHLSGHILESKGSIQYDCKRAHLDLLFPKKASKTVFFFKRAHFLLI